MYKNFRICTVFLFLSINVFSQNALQFDGVNDYAQSGIAGPTGNMSRTVEAWINWRGNITTQGVIVDWGTATNGNRFTLNMINGVPRIEVQGNGINADTTLLPSLWHHVAATYNNSNDTIKLYVDGRLSAQGVLTVTINTSNQYPITIGRRADVVSPLSLFSYFDGAIDEVRIWDKVLSNTEIINNIMKEFCIASNNLVAYYNFNEGDAGGNNTSINSVTEKISNNDALLYNFGLTANTSNFIQGANLSSITASVTQNINILSANNGFVYQWLNCNVGYLAVSGATNQIFQAAVPGNYAVLISQNWCSDTSECYAVANVGINDIEEANNFIVTPNPVKKNAQLNITGNSKNPIHFAIKNLQGQTLVTQSAPSNFIPVPNELESGLYILEIENLEQKLNTKIFIGD